MFLAGLDDVAAAKAISRADRGLLSVRQELLLEIFLGNLLRIYQRLGWEVGAVVVLAANYDWGYVAAGYALSSFGFFQALGQYVFSRYCKASHPVRALHGTQVGIGTLISAYTLSQLVALDPQAFRDLAQSARRDDDAWIDAIDADHPRLTAPVVAELKTQLRAKQKHGEAHRAELDRLAERWPELRDRLSGILLSPQHMMDALSAAGCPRRASTLGATLQDFVRTIRVCRHIRSRYTNFDLADDLGQLDAWAVEAAYWVETGSPTP